jgi:predicted nucleic acid-binding protein
MKLLLDTNVLVAAVMRDTERSDTAVELLNEAEETYVSVLGLMELRSVLTKKKKNRSNATGSPRSRTVLRPAQRSRSPMRQI